jgi:large subunit ribosomal protein L4
MSAANIRNVSLDELELAGSVRDISPVCFATWMRVLAQNWRQGTVGCKSRSEVARTNKKPWKQKGTGRARAGTARSPLWKGGGVIFGPQPRTRTLKTSKELRRGVLGQMIADLLKNQSVLCLDWLPQEEFPKTSIAYGVLKDSGLHEKRVTLLVSVDDIVSQASFANVPNVSLLLFDQVNAFDLATSDCVLFFQKDFGTFKEMVSRWI